MRDNDNYINSGNSRGAGENTVTTTTIIIIMIIWPEKSGTHSGKCRFVCILDGFISP